VPERRRVVQRLLLQRRVLFARVVLLLTRRSWVTFSRAKEKLLLPARQEGGPGRVSQEGPCEGSPGNGLWMQENRW
jgi:hypothetical protein